MFDKKELNYTLVCFLILTGFLFNLSIINFGERGVPSYIAVVFMSIIISASAFLKMPRFIGYLWLCLFLFLSVFFIQSVLVVGSLSTNLLQLISRASLVVYAIVTFTLSWRLPNYKKEKFLNFITMLCILTILLGIYEAFAIRVGLPVYHHVFANNPSFSQAVVGVTNGWNESFRIRGVCGEASYSSPFVFLVGSLIIFHLKNINSRVYCFFLFILLGAYSFFTFSRSVWFIYTIVFTYYWFYPKISKLINSSPKSFLYIYLMISILVLHSWVFLIGYYFDDTSSSGRASSVIIGFQIWMDNFWVGTGFNSYLEYSHMYSTSNVDAGVEPVVHNWFIAMAQQLGIFGLLIIIVLFKFLYKVCTKNVFFYMSFMWICIGSLQVDISYFSIFWLSIFIGYLLKDGVYVAD